MRLLTKEVENQFKQMEGKTWEGGNLESKVIVKFSDDLNGIVVLVTNAMYDENLKDWLMQAYVKTDEWKWDTLTLRYLSECSESALFNIDCVDCDNTVREYVDKTEALSSIDFIKRFLDASAVDDILSQEQFEQLLVAYLKERLSLYYDRERVRILEYVKTNIKVRSVTIRFSNSPMATQLDINSYYHAYRKDVYRLSAILRQCVLDAEGSRNAMPAVDVDNLVIDTSRIMVHLINYERNIEYLRDKYYKRYEDLALVYRYVFCEDNAGLMSSVITNKMIEEYNIDIKLLEDTVFEDTIDSNTYQVRSILSMLADMAGATVNEEGSPVARMYVATNIKGTDGSGALLSKKVADFCDKIDSDLIVLPSSIHEVLLIPIMDLDEPVDYNQLRALVTDINSTAVEPRDFLSNNVYLYKKESKTFKIV